MKYKTIINNVEFDVEIDGDGNVFVNGEARDIEFSGIVILTLFNHQRQ